jgi:hypothetical protein
MSRSRRCAFALVVALVALAPGRAGARDCPSCLQTRMWEPLDYLAVGAELRGFYVGGHVGGGLPNSDPAKPWNHDPAGALRLSVGLHPLAALSIIVEGEVSSAGNYGRPTEGYIEYAPERWAVRGGLQTLTFGSGALLDQHFLALDLKLKTRLLDAEVFGGVTNRFLEKSATNCMFIGYTAHTQLWRALPEGLDSAVAGAVLSTSALDPFDLRAMYLFSWPGASLAQDERTAGPLSSTVRDLRSHGAALSFSGPIVGEYLTFTLEPMLLVNADRELLPAMLVELRSRPMRGMHLRLGSAVSFRQGDGLGFSPVYENLSYAPLQRFNLHQGRLLAAEASYRINRFVQPFAGYAFRFQEPSAASPDTGDELRAGVELRISELYRLGLSYVAVNLAGPHRTSHLGMAELRVVLGPQLNRKGERP